MVLRWVTSLFVGSLLIPYIPFDPKPPKLFPKIISNWTEKSFLHILKIFKNSIKQFYCAFLPRLVFVKRSFTCDVYDWKCDLCNLESVIPKKVCKFFQVCDEFVSWQWLKAWKKLIDSQFCLRWAKFCQNTRYASGFLILQLSHVF